MTYLIQVGFAPCFQSFQEQQLYAFAGMDVPDLAAYALRLVKPMDPGGD